MTPKGTRPRGEGPEFRVVRDEADEPDLMAGIRERLATGEPLDVLAEVSGLLAVLDPRSRDPLERSRGAASEVSVDMLMETFEGVDRAETTVLLSAISQLGFDEDLRGRASRAVSRRRHPVPGWLERLSESVVYQAIEMVHVLGDGDDLVLGVRLPAGHELTVVIYVDHNMGTVVKDAFVVPSPIGEIIGLMKAHHEAPEHTEWRPVGLDDARARAEEALARGAMLWPPMESDTWPVCRPLVEWAVRLLPESGTGYRRPEWSDEDRAELTEAFFSSRFAEDIQGDSYRDLFESLLWFGCDYGPGDPLRWSPVSVEIVLTDWIPRKVTAGVGFLAKAPKLLRAFIRYAHDRQGVPASLTAQTLGAVDEWEPEYQRLIRTPRAQGPYALLAAMGALDPEGPWEGIGGEWDELDDWSDPGDINQIMLESLCRDVGGEKALEALDATPLPDEEFVWEGVSDDVRDTVTEVLGWCDRYADDVLDVEYRTAFRRLLARVALGDPQVFRRRARTVTAAAAVCWIIGKANDLFTTGGGGMLVKDLAAYFGLQQSGVSQRAATLMKAAGIGSKYYYAAWDVHLGSADLLVSRRRQKIIELRDRYSAGGS